MLARYRSFSSLSAADVSVAWKNIEREALIFLPQRKEYMEFTQRDILSSPLPLLLMFSAVETFITFTAEKRVTNTLCESPLTEIKSTVMKKIYINTGVPKWIALSQFAYLIHYRHLGR